MRILVVVTLRSLVFLDEGFLLFMGVNRLCIQRYFLSSMFIPIEATLMMTDDLYVSIE